jgi:hypothetical protein
LAATTTYQGIKYLGVTCERSVVAAIAALTNGLLLAPDNGRKQQWRLIHAVAGRTVIAAFEGRPDLQRPHHVKTEPDLFRVSFLPGTNRILCFEVIAYIGWRLAVENVEAERKNDHDDSQASALLAALLHRSEIFPLRIRRQSRSIAMQQDSWTVRLLRRAARRASSGRAKDLFLQAVSQWRRFRNMLLELLLGRAEPSCCISRKNPVRMTAPSTEQCSKLPARLLGSASMTT